MEPLVFLLVNPLLNFQAVFREVFLAACQVVCLQIVFLQHQHRNPLLPFLLNNFPVEFLEELYRILTLKPLFRAVNLVFSLAVNLAVSLAAVLAVFQVVFPEEFQLKTSPPLSQQRIFLAAFLVDYQAVFQAVFPEAFLVVFPAAFLAASPVVSIRLVSAMTNSTAITTTRPASRAHRTPHKTTSISPPNPAIPTTTSTMRTSLI